MTESSMYWLTRLDSIHSFVNGICFPLTLIASAACLVMLVTYVFAKIAESSLSESDYCRREYEDARKVFRMSLKTFLCTGIAALALNAALTFVPTTKEMAAIKVVPVLAGPGTAAKMKEMSSDLFDAAAQWLKKTAANGK